MNPTCKFCNKQLIIDNPKAFMSFGSVSKTEETMTRYVMYICNLCRSPVYDSMYKEVYSQESYTHKVNGQLGETVTTYALLAKAALIDDFYVILANDYHLGHLKCPYTRIYKDIVGTVAHSIELEPITQYPPVCHLDYLIDLPFDNIEALKNKLNTYTLFS